MESLNFLRYYQIFIFIAVQAEYEKYPKSDCPNDLGKTLKSDGTSDHVNCVMECNSNNECAAFALWRNTCYFKNRNCSKDMFNRSDVDVYIKKGS